MPDPKGPVGPTNRMFVPRPRSNRNCPPNEAKVGLVSEGIVSGRLDSVRRSMSTAQEASHQAAGEHPEAKFGLARRP